ncbi:unnamed protein product [Protopolystoma xenopodis]|uniref:Uncharacterized protein n=1 Tax=Protopolystoma xenopodis TaxID=117903 RepID=A0A3S5FBK4_9PLAT|nr:unnamed protein product [Protopolystoma xenopodis]
MSLILLPEVDAPQLGLLGQYSVSDDFASFLSVLDKLWNLLCCLQDSAVTSSSSSSSSSSPSSLESGAAGLSTAQVEAWFHSMLHAILLLAVSDTENDGCMNVFRGTNIHENDETGNTSEKLGNTSEDNRTECDLTAGLSSGSNLLHPVALDSSSTILPSHYCHSKSASCQSGQTRDASLTIVRSRRWWRWWWWCQPYSFNGTSFDVISSAPSALAWSYLANLHQLLAEEAARPAELLIMLPLLACIQVETMPPIISACLTQLNKVSRRFDFIVSLFNLYQSWRPLLTRLSNFLTRGPYALRAIFSQELALPSTYYGDIPSPISSTTCLELLSEMFCIFVSWSSERQCPLELSLLEAHLTLLSYSTQPAKELSSSASWLNRLIDTWFIPDVSDPILAGIESNDAILYYTSHLPDLHPLDQSLETSEVAEKEVCTGSREHSSTIEFVRTTIDGQGQSVPLARLTSHFRQSLILTTQPKLIAGEQVV